MAKERSPHQEWLQLRSSATPLPGLNLGATDSAHDVRFARDHHDIVAIKPYVGPDSLGRAKHERDMLRDIATMGFLTLRPVRIDQTRDGTMAYLITGYEPGLTMMSAVVQDRERGVRRLVKGTAATLGDLHSAGISHGDAQIKNFGIVTTQPGRIAVIDPEKGGTDKIGHFKNDPYQHDLDSLVQSLAYKRYGGPNPTVAQDEIMAHVIEPYATHAANGLGVEMAEQIGLQALDTFAQKHEALNPQVSSKR